MRSMTRREVREFERRAIEELGVPGLVLMENAGRQAAEAAAQLLAARRGRLALIVAGGGNNGGDAFVVARHLLVRGYRAEVVLVAEAGKIRGDAAVNLGALGPLGVHVTESGADPAGVRRMILAAGAVAELVVDGLLGTGLAGPVREPHLSAIAAMNELGAGQSGRRGASGELAGGAAEAGSGRAVLALDIPSGLDADTGQPLGAAVRATVTVTFVAAKVGFAQPSAAEFVGRLIVADIGVPVGE